MGIGTYNPQKRTQSTLKNKRFSLCSDWKPNLGSLYNQLTLSGPSLHGKD